MGDDQIMVPDQIDEPVDRHVFVPAMHHGAVWIAQAAGDERRKPGQSGTVESGDRNGLLTCQQVFGDGILCACERLQYFSAGVGQPLPSGGEHQHAAARLGQGNWHPALQRGKLLGYGRRRKVQSLGYCSYRAPVPELAQGSQVMHFHEA